MNAACGGLVAIAAWFQLTDARTLPKASVWAATVAIIVPLMGGCIRCDDDGATCLRYRMHGALSSDE